MNYEQLKTFVTVAEKKNFSESAKALYLSQPTITSHIKSLERQLNTSLFERTTKQVELTPAANILNKYAKEIIKLSESAEKEISKLLGEIHGYMCLASSLTIGEHILPQLLGEFKEHFPLVDMKVEITNTEKILGKIKNHVIDIGMIEAPIEDPDLILEPFMEDELVLITRSDFFPEEKVDITLEELVTLPFVLREKGSGTRAVMHQHLTKNGLKPDELNIVLELGSTESVKVAVEAGIGTSIISKSSIKKELQLKSLKAYPIRDLILSRFFYLVYHRDSVLKAPTEAFMNVVFNEVNQGVFQPVSS
ncbi:selenium metabolism-associated LysR family transcriptional regulator [Halalkalibacter krulwichiae]|uniref:HTH-type transcriptional regulator CysL n=1 Tax=Halalkalibacter krulwichiae TaxID=199441 RepID=A0A1X9MB11_9BACI|nr:selenium metabolism-associated LysR family transcriptional regulator [Halalkalibacter krulwichiae]ARK29780.1 HTH-type transcriptional regulator CysL [Halalkalibacter krulwichiae]